ncbi:MAG TPA: UDP-N-acetylmuramoyl-L-alanyl-D-glutamate--2,6-diaminopimelate ligase [Exilispira sp.]|nr:UDP-N-acetylmuramoyl-L-alanyl-D-glutamate--2,6-diaminopimelate ligase [Spirochaetota bacterium]NLJ04482.1 UDP-N-acetylmuramoyl-L-alanyl-D-glutamate--2,6-diaminopimelate ligase [Exilispira sp.]HNV44144.1 UDP-N-acetylmuramoyl-L-alanyl-D-glutamate--2,6-diaminopimelate ligase [Exilispira sp.]HOV46020.1 UDP-N-acetylmuramoyl-L-alanyl-D-glutamate--2,6-diaminopimelate ligase [Exilispira sp.]
MRVCSAKEYTNFLKEKRLILNLYDPCFILNKLQIMNICANTQEIEKQYHESLKSFSNVEDEKKSDITICFIGIKGSKFNSHTKIPELTCFAKFIVAQSDSIKLISNDIEKFCKEKNVCLVEVQDSKEAMAFLFKYFYDLQDEQFNIFAFTGTDGKTSMVTILQLLFNRMKFPAASIGTLGIMKGYKNFKLSKSTPTTPEIYDLYNILYELKKKDVSNIFIEATSIASVQKRLSSISFDTLSFTTLTSDHLDFHGTLASYYEAKLKFIDQLAASDKPIKILFYNTDDSNADLVFERASSYPSILIAGYGFSNRSDFKIDAYSYTDNKLMIDVLYPASISNLHFYNKRLSSNPDDSGFEIKFRQQLPFKKINLRSNLIGKANVYNITHAFAILYLFFTLFLKKTVDHFEKIILSNKAVFEELMIPGRFERISYMGHDIYIDYAHTADAIENAIKTLKEAGYKSIITIMGCGGDRDQSKRAPMGKVASELSDIFIITSDNPRNEEPEKIIEDILKGVNKNNFLVESDRKKAISTGIEKLKMMPAASALLIAGKGHEDYIEKKGVKYHFSDKEEVLKIILKNKT